MGLKNKVNIIILFILLSTTGFLFGPKEPIDPTLNKISLPHNLSDLNQMIKTKEGKLEDIRPGL